MTVYDLIHSVGINVNERDHPDLYAMLLKLLER